MKKFLSAGLLVGLMVSGASVMTAGAISIQTGELAGPTDWLADVRFRNFQTAVSGEYEMMVNASPTRTVGQQQVNGQVPNFAYNQAAWAEDNDFWITYDPTANSVSLRLVGSGTQAGGATAGYDITIARAPDAVAAPVNYMNFQLWDRGNFPTFIGGLTISSLDGSNLGNFTIPTAGIGSWSILDPGGATLNDGFILSGSFTLDLAKVAEGKEGDKVMFLIGSNPNVPASVPDGGATVALLGLALAGVAGLRRKLNL